MSIHELKIWPLFYKSVVQGSKTAEYRYNDRGFADGDALILKEYEMGNRGYTGREVKVLVTHILFGGMFGVPEGYCVMSIKVMRK